MNKKNNFKRERIFFLLLFIIIIFFAFFVRIRETLLYDFPLAFDSFGDVQYNQYISIYEELPEGIPFIYPSTKTTYPILHYTLSSILHVFCGFDNIFLNAKFFGPFLTSLSLIPTYVLIYYITKKKTYALMGCMFLAFTPMLIIRGSMTVPDNIFVFMTTIILYLCSRGISEINQKMFYIATFFISVGMGFHISFIILYIPLLFSIFFTFRSVKKNKHIIKTILLCLLISTFFIFISYPHLFKVSSWFIKQNMSKTKSIFNTSAPSFDMYIKYLGYLLISLATIGVFNKKIKRSYVPLFSLFLVLFLFLQIMPSLNIINLSPFRFFTYIILPMTVIAMNSLRMLNKKVIILILIVLLVTGFSKETKNGTMISKNEYEGMLWLKENIEENSVVISQPFERMRISAVSARNTSSYLSEDVFLAKSDKESYNTIKKSFGNNSVYVFLSLYKIRYIKDPNWLEQIYPHMNISIFSNENLFEEKYENEDVKIWYVRK